MELFKFNAITADKKRAVGKDSVNIGNDQFNLAKLPV
jgi:hypothetical protein